MNLPDTAQDKLAALRDSEIEMQGRFSAVFAAIDAAQQKANTSHDGDTAQQYADEAERLRSRLHGLREQHQAIAQLNGQIRQWLDRNRNVEFVAAKPVKVDLSKRKANELLASIRSEINDLTRERRQLTYECAPTAAEAKKASDAWVDSLADSGRPIVAASHQAFAVSFGPATKIESVLAWMAPDRFKARLHEEIDAALAKAPRIMSATLRTKRLAEVESRLSEAALTEESVIVAAMADGITNVLRRVDADPAGVLGVVRKNAAAKAA